LWTGTGTVVPTQVTDRLAGYVDNEYLGMGLRGGILGEALLLLMLASVAVAGWRSRGSPRPLVQVLGAMALTSAIVLAVLARKPGARRAAPAASD
jgi:O-antigen ligase